MPETERKPAVRRQDRLPKRAWILALLAAMAIFGYVFLQLASEVREGDSRSIDRAILLSLRVAGQLETPRGPAWLRESVTDLSSLGSPTVLSLVVLLACGYLLTQRRPYLAAVCLAVIGSGSLAANVFKRWFDRARPEVVPHLVPVNSLSFPSGHAADSAMVYLTLAMLLTSVEQRRSTRIFMVAAAIALTLMIGLTRLYLGVHWPSDVLAGWVFGSGWALVGHFATKVFNTAHDEDVREPIARSFRRG